MKRGTTAFFTSHQVLATQKVAYFYNLEDKARLQMKVSESDLGLGVDGLTLSKGGITSGKKTPFFFECCPYVCPEPVLVKRSFFI
eukprot:COSAG06_NODE_1739_length_8515_cov_19.652804_6_plen_85_part_00